MCAVFQLTETTRVHADKISYFQPRTFKYFSWKYFKHEESDLQSSQTIQGPIFLFFSPIGNTCIFITMVKNCRCFRLGFCLGKKKWIPFSLFMPSEARNGQLIERKWKKKLQWWSNTPKFFVLIWMKKTSISVPYVCCFPLWPWWNSMD